MVKKDVKFFEPSEVLERQKHRGIRWRCLAASCEVNCCVRARDTAIALHEIPSASRFFPIVFPYIRQLDGSLSLEIRAVYALSLNYCDVDDEAGCAYLNPERGCTLGENRLLACKKYPFAAVKDAQNQDNFGLKIALDCPGWSYEEGELVLDEKGEITEKFQREFINPLLSFMAGNPVRNDFLTTITRLGLLVPRDILYRDIRVRVNTIDIEKLKQLDPYTLKKLVSKDYLRLMYHAYDSLANFTILIDRYYERRGQS